MLLHSFTYTPVPYSVIAVPTIAANQNEGSIFVWNFEDRYSREVIDPLTSFINGYAPGYTNKEICAARRSLMRVLTPQAPDNSSFDNTRMIDIQKNMPNECFPLISHNLWHSLEVMNREKLHIIKKNQNE